MHLCCRYISFRRLFNTENYYWFECIIRCYIFSTYSGIPLIYMEYKLHIKVYLHITPIHLRNNACFLSPLMRLILKHRLLPQYCNLLKRYIDMVISYIYSTIYSYVWYTSIDTLSNTVNRIYCSLYLFRFSYKLVVIFYMCIIYSTLQITYMAI